jgi:hypothetical protein
MTPTGTTPHLSLLSIPTIPFGPTTPQHNYERKREEEGKATITGEIKKSKRRREGTGKSVIGGVEKKVGARNSGATFLTKKHKRN